MITLELGGLVTNSWEDKVLVVVWEQGLTDSMTALRNLSPHRTYILKSKWQSIFKIFNGKL